LQAADDARKLCDRGKTPIRGEGGKFRGELTLFTVPRPGTEIRATGTIKRAADHDSPTPTVQLSSSICAYIRCGYVNAAAQGNCLIYQARRRTK